jgi:hypothetical protein
MEAMRRSTLPSLALIGVLAATALTGCGGDDDVPDPASTLPTPDETTEAAPPTDDATEEETEEPTETTDPEEPACEPAGHSRSEEFLTLEQPAECAVVSGSFTASGEANSPEANVPWRILDADGNDMGVQPGYVTAEGWLDQLYPWSIEIDVSGLAPGTYVFEAMTDDPSDGEGRLPDVVAATIVVE